MKNRRGSRTNLGDGCVKGNGKELELPSERLKFSTAATTPTRSASSMKSVTTLLSPSSSVTSSSSKKENNVTQFTVDTERKLPCRPSNPKSDRNCAPATGLIVATSTVQQQRPLISPDPQDTPMKSSSFPTPVALPQKKRRGRPPKNKPKDKLTTVSESAQLSGHRPCKRPRLHADHEGIVEQVNLLTGTLYIFKGKNPRVEFIRRV